MTLQQREFLLFPRENISGFVLNSLVLATVESSVCCDFNLESHLPLTVSGNVPTYPCEIQQSSLLSPDSICDHVKIPLFSYGSMFYVRINKALCQSKKKKHRSEIY